MLRVARPLVVVLLAGLMVTGWLSPARERGLVRVEVIAPSRPLVDDYFPLTMVARSGSGAIDRGFAGEVWLWTDGSHLRPFHVEFRAEDQGVIRLPVRLELPRLARIEAYHPAGTLQTWSNPVWPREGGAEGRHQFFAGALPVFEDNAGPGLYWGKLDDCAEPGLDFCLSSGPEDPRPMKAGPLVLPLLTRQIKGETWAVALDPSLGSDEKNDLASAINRAKRFQKLERIAAADGRAVVLGRIGDEPVPLSELVEKDAPILIAPGRDCRLGVWSDELSSAGIFRALSEGRAYCSCGGRIMMWLIAAEGGKAMTLFVAGHGPREQVRVYRKGGGSLAKAIEKESDDFSLQVALPAAAGGWGPCYIEVIEADRRALAGPVRLRLN